MKEGNVMRRKCIVFTTMAIIVVMLGACNKDTSSNIEEMSKPVVVIKAAEEYVPVVMDYIGTVTPQEMKRMAFKSSGRIRSIPVEKGQLIKTGEVIAELDTEDLRYSLMASEAQMEAAHARYMKALNGANEEDINNAQLNVRKARDLLEFAEDIYEKMKLLYDASAISKQELDKAKLDMDIRQSDLTQAEELLSQLVRGSREEDKTALFHQYQQAQADYLYRKSLLEDGLLTADTDGYIVEILFKEGELYTGGHPIVILRDEDQVVKIGVTSEDLMKVEVGMETLVIAENQQWRGKVSHINNMPNEITRTYAVEIHMPEGEFPIGTIANVQLMMGHERGISIPISAILSEGEDFVFVVDNDKAKKRKIEIYDVIGTNALVKGIKDGELIVVEGMKRLRDNDQVILKDRDEK